MKPKEVINQEGIERALTRITHEILEQNKGPQELAIIGIRTRGVFIADRVAKKIYDIEQTVIPVGSLDITLYRDDFRDVNQKPNIKRTEIDFVIKDKKIILVDDVLFTGRTIRAAIDCIMDFGRPKCIRLAVLVDRGHRELPIRPDYVGKNIPTSMTERVKVMLREVDGDDRVIIYDER